MSPQPSASTLDLPSGRAENAEPAAGERPGRGAGSNLPEYTVSEISSALKRTVEDAYGHVRVRGEISQPRYHGSGHLYLTLKDDRAVLAGVCWRATVPRLALRAEEGLEVVCTGRLSTFAGQSKYQLVIDSMALAGEGALLKLLEERRKRLAAEGLFDPERKRPLPFLPEVIGVVTSPTGAVIRDILHRLADRFPRRVLLWPVPMQGEAAAPRIAEAIAGLDALEPGGAAPRPDLLIVARGGGSLEDLMPFNEESVVRAAAACRIPLITAVGHETDTTLIDHAADRRAPTPSAAAEMAVPVRAELAADLLDRERRLLAAAARLVAERRLRVDGLARGLGDPARLLEGALQRLDDRGDRLDRVLPVLLERRRARLAELGRALVSPEQRLAELRRQVAQLGERLNACCRYTLDRRRQGLDSVAGRLRPEPLRRRIAGGADRLAGWAERPGPAAVRLIEARAARVQALSQLLESYSYKDVLRRGFVVVRDAEGQPRTDPDALRPGMAVSLEYHDDRQVEATIGRPGDSGAAADPRPDHPRRRRARAEAPLSRQGKLF